MPRNLFIGGNWKCNGTVESLTKLVKEFNEAGEFKPNRDIVIAPTALHIGMIKSMIRPDIKLATQNLWKVDGYGAFTGELSAPMIKDFGLEWTLTGHSERRHTVAAESNELIAEKTKIALKHGLKVILCIGELLEERQAGKTMEVCKAQVQACIDILEEKDWENIVIAYEPVWAIGTGVTASPEQAQEVHHDLRQYIKEAISEKVANEIRIIYGGSANAKNCDNLIAQEDIDGFLVGGASLKPEFIKIINCGN
ncbi:hypothetical protein WA158_000007 [Blastocystis sp. Blastoise]